MASNYKQSSGKQSNSGGAWVRLLQALGKSRGARQGNSQAESSATGVSQDITTETKRLKEELLRTYTAPCPDRVSEAARDHLARLIGVGQ